MNDRQYWYWEKRERERAVREDMTLERLFLFPNCGGSVIWFECHWFLFWSPRSYYMLSPFLLFSLFYYCLCSLFTYRATSWLLTSPLSPCSYLLSVILFYLLFIFFFSLLFLFLLLFSQDGKTPLHYACDKNRLDVVRILVIAGSKISEPDRVRESWGWNLNCIEVKIINANDCK